MQRLLFLGYIENLACPHPSFHVPIDKVAALQAMAKETVDTVGSKGGRVQGQARRNILDVCAGVCAAGEAHLEDHADTYVIAVDIMAEEEFWKGVAPGLAALRGVKVFYVKMDVIDLTLEVVRSLLRKHLGIELCELTLCHWSPMCSSMSRASRGRGDHRRPDGSPKSDVAIAHDLRFHHVLAIVVAMVAEHGTLLCQIENPLGPVFPYFEDMMALVGQPGWRFVLRADHCVMADTTERHRRIANKPTSWMLHGVPSDVEFPICDRSCPFRLSPSSPFHRWLVCRRRNMRRGQRVVGSLRDKSRVPLGAHRRIFDAHLQWLAGEQVAAGSRVPAKRVAKIVGRLVSMGLAVAPSQLMCRDLVRTLYSNDHMDWEEWVRVSPEAVEELLWIVRHLAEWNDTGIEIWRPAQVVDIAVTQDSSPAGVGFRLETGGMVVWEGHFPFRVEEGALDHVHREMLGLVFVFLSGRHRLRDRQVQVRVDSRSTVKYVARRGGSKAIMNFLAKKLWSICIANRISIVAVGHISGQEMVRVGVDGLSRPVEPKALSEADRAGWQLMPHIWQEVRDAVHPVEFSCDRFACRADALLPRFNSLQVEPGALLPPNALVHDWRVDAQGRPEFNWAFPPLRHVASVFHLVRQQGAWACMLIPDWCREWYPAIMREAVWVWPLAGAGPFFRRLRGGEWQPVEQNLFRPLIVLLDFRS